MNKYFKSWYFWATHSRLDPMVKAAKTLKSHIANILTYAKHKVTNAIGESINSKIEKMKRLACGYRNRGHYRTAILFHCGGLYLYPQRKQLEGQIFAA
jgi:transposase